MAGFDDLEIVCVTSQSDRKSRSGKKESVFEYTIRPKSCPVSFHEDSSRRTRCSSCHGLSQLARNIIQKANPMEFHDMHGPTERNIAMLSPAAAVDSVQNIVLSV
jgi:hypothetical protein